MNDIIGQIYNRFLLRDFLGYVIPGSFVLGCAIHFGMTYIYPTPLKAIISAPAPGVVIWLFIASLCYACGHFLSGIFFHSYPFRRVFAYFPAALTKDYPGVDRDEAWATHRSKYIAVATDSTGNFQGYIERHAALLHFTGHFSAGLIFTMIYIGLLSLKMRDLHLLVSLVPLAVILPGIYLHYRRLAVERYQIEKSAIEAGVAKQKQVEATPPAKGVGGP